MTTPAVDSDAASYVAAVLILYINLPETPLRASAPDQWLARRLHDRGVPCGRICSPAGLSTPLVRSPDVPPLTPIRSLAYFQPVIEELVLAPPPDNYLDYLRLKLRNAAKSVPAKVQKNTFSHDR